MSGPVSAGSDDSVSEAVPRKSSNIASMEPARPLEDAGRSPASAGGRKARAIDAPAYSFPIAPSVIEEFPHLAGFEGHILLGNGLVQVVISGAASAAKATVEHDLILGFYERRGSVFYEMNSFQRVSAAQSRSKGNRSPSMGQGGLIPLAVDTGVNDVEAFVRIVFGQSGQKLRYQWRIRLSPSSRAVAASWEHAPVEVADEGVPARKAVATGALIHPWSLRVYFGKSGRIMLPLEEPVVAGTKSKIEKKALYSYLRARDRDVVGIVATSPFQVESNEQSDDLISLDKTAQNDGVEFIVGGIAGSSTLVRTETRQRCLLEPSNGGALSREGIEKAIACVTQFPINGVDLRVWPGDASLAGSPSRGALILNGDRQIVGYTILGDRAEPLLTQLPGNQPFRVQSIWHDTEAEKSILVQKNQIGFLEAPPTLQGTVFVSLGSDDGTEVGWDFPTTATLRTLDHEPWVGMGSLTTTATVLDHGRLLITRWPLKLELPIGRYEIEVARAPFHCLLAFSVAASETKKFSCSLTKPKEWAQAIAEKESFQADFSTFADEYSSYVLSTASGSSILLKEMSMDRYTKTEKGQKRLLPAMVERHQGSGFSLAAFPADDGLVNLWRPVRKESGTDRLVGFREFVEKYRPEALTVMSCPGHGTVLDDYVALLDRIRPAAVQIFGCFENAAVEGKFQTVALEYSAKAAKPLILLPGEFKVLKGGSPWAPRLRIAGGDITGAAGVSPQRLIGNLRLGQYRITSGIHFDYEILPPSEKSKTTILKLAWKSLAEVKPLVILLHSNAGNDVVIPIGVDNLGLLEIPLPLGSSWFRVEIRGDDGSRLRRGNAADILLGSSPIFQQPKPLIFQQPKPLIFQQPNPQIFERPKSLGKSVALPATKINAVDADEEGI